ncbi:MAG: undecaprenyl-diphosphatase, partial [Pseudomonadota bacterium]|nr:undecaprenyl-diphosphatase [Pseudomonadota bacterium]
MDQFNIQLFMALNAPAGLHGLALIIPVLIEKYLIFAVPVLMIFEWLWSETSQRNQLVVTLIAILFSLKLAQFAGHHWFFPRPDVLGIGHTYLAH